MGVAKWESGRRGREASLFLSRLSPATSSPDRPREAEFVTRIIRSIVSGWFWGTYKADTPGDAQMRKTGDGRKICIWSSFGAGDAQMRNRRGYVCKLLIAKG